MSYLFSVLFLVVSSAYSDQAGVEDYDSHLIEIRHFHGVPPPVYYPPPVIVNPVPPFDPVCGFGRGSICYTHQGNTCTSYVLSYQPSWLSACISLGHGIFTFCTNTPAFQWPSLVFQQTCALRQTPCMCSFERYSYKYDVYITVYEQGNVF